MVSSISQRSQPLSSQTQYVSTGSISSLEICNFKSYGGTHNIGPFQQFTAVIGPNGTGKSNLMDAISFVLGVKTQPLRGLKLKDLLFSKTKDDSQQQEQATRGHVKLVFQDNQDQEIQFQRTIQATSSTESGDDAQYRSTYRVDNREISFKEYIEALKTLGVLVEARNFLVFQGEIEGVAQMQPEARRKLIEKISGSIDFEKQYDELEQEKARLEDKVRYLNQKKSQMKKEVKDKKDEKSEADKYEEQLRALRELQLDKYMLLLYQLNKRQQDSAEVVDSAKTSILQIEQQIQENENELQSKKKQAGQLIKKKQGQEKKVQKAKKDNLTQVNDMQRVNKEVQYLERSLRKVNNDLQTKVKEQEEQAKLIAKLQQDLTRLEETEQQLNLNLEQQQQQEQFQTSEENMQAYYQLKNQVGIETSRLQEELSVLFQQQQAEKDLQTSLLSTINNIKQEIKLANDQTGTQDSRLSKQKDVVEKKKSELQQTEEVCKKLDENTREYNARREVIQQKLEQVERNLSEARVVYNETRKDRIINTTLQEFSKRFKGVYGRLTDLAKIPNRKYNLAATIILGKEMDSIVVDNEATAKQCIQYLRQNKITPMTFIPIETLQAGEVRDDLRQLGGTCVLLIDVLEFKKEVEKAFIYACGSTVVCATVDEARYVALGGQERLKVVSLDGTLINKNGNMTGGMTSSLDERSKRWTDDSVQQLRDEKSKYLNSMSSLLSDREHRDQRMAYDATISRLRNEIRLNEQDIAQATTTHAAIQDKLSQQNSVLDTFSKQLQDVEGKIDKLQTRINAKKRSVDSVSDRIYNQFSSQLGIQSIREFEENQVKQWEDIMVEKKQINQQKAKISAQLSYEQTLQLTQLVQELQNKSSQEQSQLSSLQGKLQQLQDANAIYEQNLENLKSELEQTNTSVASIESETKAVNSSLLQQRRELSKLQVQNQKSLQQLEQDREMQQKTVQEANMEQITIPLISQDGEAMDSQQETIAMESQGTVDQSQAFERAQVNFDVMSKKLRTDNLSQAQKYLKDLKEKIQETHQKLKSMQVNLKASEQYEQALNREQEQLHELNQLNEEYSNNKEHFSQVRQKRLSIFMDAFDHIVKVIDPIYKELTKSREHILGGSAQLILENQKEPFNGGLIYAAVPPSKAYRLMEELSGGERTLASLALLFAIHSYRPSPFFVLDEVDSALDASNLMRVASYLRRRTRHSMGRDRFQAIVISLKEKFFSTSDCLVGTCRDQSQQRTKVLTLDLNQFDVYRAISGRPNEGLEDDEERSSTIPRSFHHQSNGLHTPA